MRRRTRHVSICVESLKTALVDPKTAFEWNVLHRFWHMLAQSRRECVKGKMSTEQPTIWNSSASKRKGNQK